MKILKDENGLVHMLNVKDKHLKTTKLVKVRGIKGYGLLAPQTMKQAAASTVHDGPIAASSNMDAMLEAEDKEAE